MLRISIALFFIITAPVSAADTPDAISKTLAVQAAIRDAKAALKENRPDEATKILEAQLGQADGSAEFLELLRHGYEGELKTLNASGVPNEKRLAEVSTRLGVLVRVADPVVPTKKTNETPATPTSDAPNAVENLRMAIGLFKSSNFRAAASLFAEVSGKLELRADQTAAWAYCRVKVAADELNKTNLSSQETARLIAEVEAALALSPNQAGLQKAGQEVLAAAKQKSPNTFLTSTTAKTASVVVKGQGDVAAVTRTAEAKRSEIFTRWSGPPAGAWSPVCEIQVHSDASAFADATHRPIAATGLATVAFENNMVKTRTVHLRADDPTYLNDALPRELAHVVLADLFPTQAPPTWAEVGIAVRESSTEELNRYLQAANSLRTSDRFTVSELFALNGYPDANRTTAFYAQSAAVVDYFVKQKGEKAFTTFLRDWQRYGSEAALRRNYNTTATALEQAVNLHLSQQR